MIASSSTVRTRNRTAASRLRNWFVAGLVVTSGATVAMAQRAAVTDTLRLTVQDATARAVANSPRLASLAASRRAADATARGARAAGLPSIDLSAGYTRFSEVPEFGFTLPGGAHQIIAPNLPDLWRARAAASVPLWTGGRVAGAAEAARSEGDAAEGDLAAARADLLLETISAYWNLRMSRERTAVLQEALVAYEAHLKDAGNRAAVGLAARNEVLSIEVERDRTALGVVQSSGASVISEADLRRLLGLGEEVAIALVDDPQVAGSHTSSRTEDATGRAMRGPDALPQFLSGLSAAGTVQRRQADSLATVALSLRPERKALLARVHAAEARVRSERGSRWPQIATVAGYDYANPNRRLAPPQEKWKESWDASVNLQLPLFDSGRISAAISRAESQAEVLGRQLEDLDRRLRLEVTARAVSLWTEELGVAVAERAVESARENERVSRDRYREGVASSSDLLDAEVRRLRAVLDLQDVQTRLLLARATLERALGRLR